MLGVAGNDVVIALVQGVRWHEVVVVPTSAYQYQRAFWERLNEVLIDVKDVCEGMVDATEVLGRGMCVAGNAPQSSIFLHSDVSGDVGDIGFLD